MSGIVKTHTAIQETIVLGEISLKIIIIHTVLSPQEIETEGYTSKTIVAPNFLIVVMVGSQTITFNGVVMVIPEFRIAMMIGSQATTAIIRMKKECVMLGIMTITILGMVPETITVF